ncbi:hypothetical protein TNCV_2201121 [Trichonephila clavipes]|uniref:Uncharacterized protein n=1 Tax=Trichonephila clavipes TaxID=2585209 RepID=A0A8X6VKT8_TRICX|nr:hypothetical protein TNCV_2201121 [Trichonephila clavipes]
MAQHRPRKPASVEYTTDEEDTNVYDMGEEIESPKMAVLLFHVLADLEYPCIVRIFFIGGSKIISDFDRKYLAIPDSQIDKVVKTVEEETVEIDLSEKKLEGKEKRELLELFDSCQGLFSGKLGLTHVLYQEIDTGDKTPVVSWPFGMIG